MKTGSILRFALGCLALALVTPGTLSEIIKSKPQIYMKVHHPPPERKLRQVQISKELGSYDYDLNDDLMEITKKQFMDQLNLRKHVNLHKPLANTSGHSRVLEGELPDIDQDFFNKVEEGLAVFDGEGYTSEKGDNMVTISKDGKKICDVKLTVEPKNEDLKEHHNVMITMDNYEYSGEFDQKMMQGLAIIEDADNHRGEISSFVGVNLPKFAEGEEDVEEKAENGMESVIKGLEEIIAEVDPAIIKVGGDANTGVVFEKRTGEGVILVLVMAYRVGDEMYEIQIKTRAMDVFEMQVREELREEDKGTLKSQLGDLVAVEAVKEGIKLEDVLNKMNVLVNTTPGELTADCPKDLKFAPDEAGVVPNTIVLNADMMDDGGGGFGFDDFGGEENAEEEKAPSFCVFQNAFVIMLQGLDMPYIFFAFRNMRIMVEHFVPAIDKTSVEAALESAYNGVMDLSLQIEKAVAENIGPDGQPVADPKEFQIQNLVDMINGILKKEKLTLKQEDEKSGNILWLQGKDVQRIAILKVGSHYKVNFNLPHKMYKDKDAVKPVTNEFIFNEDIAYDAVAVFEKTLVEFVKAVKAATGKKKKNK